MAAFSQSLKDTFSLLLTFKDDTSADTEIRRGSAASTKAL